MVVVVRDAEKDLGQLEGVLGHISYYDGVGENECNFIGKMTRYWIHRAIKLDMALGEIEATLDHRLGPNATLDDLIKYIKELKKRESK